MRRIVHYIVIALLLAILTGCKKRTIPAELQGYWTTTAPQFKDRYLEMDDTYVLIGVNEDDLPELQHASRVESQTEGHDTIYTIYSSGPEAEYKLTVRYSAANGGELRIKNRENVVWKRSPL